MLCVSAINATAVTIIQMLKAKINIEIHIDGAIHPAQIVLYDGTKYMVGRNSKDLKLAFDKVSREHCYFLLQGKKISLVDNHSSNGTKVNAIGIQSTLVQVTDVIEIGPVKIRVLSLKFQEDETSFFEKTELTLLEEGPWDWLKDQTPFIAKDLWDLIVLMARSGPLKFFNKVYFNANYIASLIILFLGCFIRANPLYGDDERLFLFELMWNIFFVGFSCLFFFLGRNIISNKGQFRHYLCFLAITTWVFTPVYMLLSLVPTGIIALPLMSAYCIYGFYKVFDTKITRPIILFSLVFALVSSVYWPVNKKIHEKSQLQKSRVQQKINYNQSDDYLKDLE